MKDKIEFICLPILLVVLFFIGRMVMGLTGAPYDDANRVFSMVILQMHLAILWAAVGRVHKKYTLTEAVTAVVMIILLSQVLIWIATVAAYMTHSSTYFNYPAALNQRTTVSFGAAMLIRAGGLIGNCIMGAILGTIGWFMGALIPAGKK